MTRSKYLDTLWTWNNFSWCFKIMKTKYYLEIEVIVVKICVSHGKLKIGTKPVAVVKFIQHIWNHLIMQFGLSHMIMSPNDVPRHTHQILGGIWVFVDASVVVLRRLAVRLFRCGFAQVVVARRIMTRFGTVGTGRENSMMFRARVSARVTEINNEINKYYIKQHMWVFF